MSNDLQILDVHTWPIAKESSGKEGPIHEWISIKNLDQKPASLAGLELVCLTKKGKGLPEWKQLYKFRSKDKPVEPGGILNVCSGRPTGEQEYCIPKLLYPHVEVYTGKKNFFIFNKETIGALSLWNPKTGKVVNTFTFADSKQEAEVCHACTIPLPNKAALLN